MRGDAVYGDIEYIAVPRRGRSFRCGESNAGCEGSRGIGRAVFFPVRLAERRERVMNCGYLACRFRAPWLLIFEGQISILGIMALETYFKSHWQLLYDKFSVCPL